MIRLYGLLFYLGMSLIIPSLSIAQEICDNGIDDDLDGFIDLNDPDCDCPILEPISLIPNPSFEDRSCCPTSRGQMDCAETWIQASVPTTDYIHTCGWTGWDNLPVPLPIPDGQACVGFRNGRFGNRTNPNWKEYAGACLIAPLRANVSYKFRFYIGFTHLAASPPTNVTFFGTADCANLPFGDGLSEFGCPTNGPNWTQLGQVSVSGENTWKQVEINVTPKEDIHAITIGPDCSLLSASGSIYYFFDNLVLAEQSEFDFDIKPTDQFCSDELLLTLPFADTLSYQWYKDGIALSGEIFSTLSTMYGDGRYEVLLTGPSGICKVTKRFNYVRPQTITENSIILCDGDIYPFGKQNLITEGVYWDTIKTALNCDSIIKMEVDVSYNRGDSVQAKIFRGESYQIGDYFFSNPGNHIVSLPNINGCDSTIFLQLEFYKVFIPTAFTPNNDGVNDIFAIIGGSDVIEIRQLSIYNRWGRLVYEDTGLASNSPSEGWNGKTGGKDAPEGVYVYRVQIIYDDGQARDATGSITLIR